MSLHQSSPDHEVGDAEFLSLTRDRAQARALRKQLQQLAEGGAGSVLQEMAKEILSGRTGLREPYVLPPKRRRWGNASAPFVRPGEK